MIGNEISPDVVIILLHTNNLRFSYKKKCLSILLNIITADFLFMIIFRWQDKHLLAKVSIMFMTITFDLLGCR